MGIQQRFCRNHPQRPAIGVCIITQKAICGECSTRYNGVNYSIEGLQILRQREQAAAGKGKPWTAWAMGICLSPLAFYLMYLSYLFTARVLIDLLHRDV